MLNRLNRINVLMLVVMLLPVVLLGADGAIWGWVTDRWATVVGVIVILLGAFWIPGLRTLMVLGLKTLVSEKVLKSIFIMLAEKLVASTKTKIDDLWLVELKRRL